MAGRENKKLKAIFIGIGLIFIVSYSLNQMVNNEITQLTEGVNQDGHPPAVIAMVAEKKQEAEPIAEPKDGAAESDAPAVLPVSNSPTQIVPPKLEKPIKIYQLPLDDVQQVM